MQLCVYNELIIGNAFEDVQSVGKDLRQINLKRWRHKTVDRVQWGSVIKEVKAKEASNRLISLCGRGMFLISPLQSADQEIPHT
jgi:hypothetical protein